MLPEPFAPPPDPSARELAAGLRQPPTAHRPVMFWCWNDDLDQAQVRWQLAQMREAGCGAVVIHPMPDRFRQRDFIAGMKTPYLSDQFFRWVRLAVQEAKRLGLYVWLYDEGGWPSGHALYQVPQGHPEYRGWLLRRRQGGVEAVPEGYPADLMNPQAVRRFIDLTHEGYRRWVGEEFGRTVVAMFTDEMRVGGCLGSDALPWTPELPRLFRERKGYELAPLEALFDSSPATARLRYDYTDLWSSLFRQSYLEQIGAWCREHGLLSIGHYPGEDEFQGPARYGSGDLLRGLAALDVPGVDAIWRQLFPGCSPDCSPDFPRLAASAARQAGKRYACSESFAVYGWGLTPAQMKWITDQQFVRGINLLAPMAAAYQVHGSGMINTSSHLAWGNPLWRFFRCYADYTGRLGWLLSQGEPVVAVALYLPVRSLWVRPEDGQTEQSVAACVQALLARQVDFDYLGDDALAAATWQQGALQVGPMRYRALLVPRAYALPAQTLCKLAALAQDGMLIAAVGRPSLAADRPEDASLVPAAWQELRELPEPAAAAELIAGHVGPTVRLLRPCPAVRCCRRRGGEFEVIFLVNESGERQDLSLEVPAGRAYLCDPETGGFSASPARRSRVAVALAPWGSALLVVDRSGAWARLVGREPAGATLHAQDCAWQARPLEQLAVSERGIESTAPEQPARPLPFDSWGRVDPYFSGRVEYTAQWDRPHPGPWTLELGAVRHCVELWVNAEPAGVRAWPPYRFAIGPYLQAGCNQLRAVVTNTLANEFARPQTRELMRRLGWHNCYRQRAEPFEAEEVNPTSR